LHKIVLKIVKCVVSYIIFTLHARNVRLQRVLRCQKSTNCDDAWKTHESRCSLNLRLASCHQRVCDCVRAGGRHFEHTMERWCDLLHIWWFSRQ